MSSQNLEPRILTTSNYLDWRIDMQRVFPKHGYHRIIHGWEVEPHQLVEQNKFLNHCDEAFGYLCTYISRDLLFHIEGLRTPENPRGSLIACLTNNMSFSTHFGE